MSIHTLDPQFRLPGYFTKENVNTISQLVTTTIAKSYTKMKVIVPTNSIVIEMQTVHEERLESVAKMNQRVVMNLVRSFMNYVHDTEQKNSWSADYVSSYNYDPSLGIKPFETPKLKGKTVGKDTEKPFRFNFTY